MYSDRKSKFKTYCSIDFHWLIIWFIISIVSTTEVYEHFTGQIESVVYLDFNNFELTIFIPIYAVWARSILRSGSGGELGFYFVIYEISSRSDQHPTLFNTKIMTCLNFISLVNHPTNVLVFLSFTKTNNGWIGLKYDHKLGTSINSASDLFVFDTFYCWLPVIRKQF